MRTAQLLRTLGPFTNPVKSVSYSDSWRVGSHVTSAGDTDAPAGSAGDADASIRAGHTAGARSADARAGDADARAGNAGLAYCPGIWVATEDNLEFFSAGSVGLYK